MRIKRLKLTGHRALQISVLPSGHKITRFQLPGHQGRQLSREPLGGVDDVIGDHSDRLLPLRGDTFFGASTEPLLRALPLLTVRRAHGAAFVTWAGFRTEQVDIQTGRERLNRYLTESGSTRTFCSCCGSTLFFEGPEYEGEIHVVLANIDEPIDRVPEAHCYVDHGAEWWTIDDLLPQYGGETGLERKE